MVKSSEKNRLRSAWRKDLLSKTIDFFTVRMELVVWRLVYTQPHNENWPSCCSWRPKTHSIRSAGVVAACGGTTETKRREHAPTKKGLCRLLFSCIVAIFRPSHCCLMNISIFHTLIPPPLLIAHQIFHHASLSQTPFKDIRDTKRQQFLFNIFFLKIIMSTSANFQLGIIFENQEIMFAKK